jgi:BASS family bile acid:Na+ symporter
MKRIGTLITRYMSVLVLAAALCAFLWPGACGFVRTSWISPLLGLVMFGMGLTLEWKAFATVFARPLEVSIGVLCQFVLMPLLAWGLARLFRLPTELAVGVLLVGCCPGGTSSNVISYLAKGDVALSVGMTTVSTLLAPVITPLLMKFFAGAVIPVDFFAMFRSILQVVILPVALGLLAKRFLPVFSAGVIPALPAFSTIVIILIVISVVAANAVKLRDCGILIMAVVVLHNLSGYALGYLAARMMRFTADKARTVSIEVGMQNSGLACSLAATHFPNLAMASVPGALFSVWHNISGALLARLYARAAADSD